MTQTEYTNLLAVITGLSARMDKGFADIRKEFIKVREEMTDGFSDVRKEMRTGFAELYAADQEILQAISEAYDDHETRIVRLETITAIK